MKKKLTRRQFLTLLSAGVTGVAGLKAGLVKGAGGPTVYLPYISKPQATPTPTATLTPTATATIPPVTGNHRVVRVHASTVTDWNGLGNYWEDVSQPKVTEMVNAGVCNLTGKGTPAEAWHDLLPNYVAGDGIAFKPNFNNTMAGDSSALSNAIPHIFLAVIGGLVSIGVRPQDISIYDGVNRRIPAYFYNPIHAAYPNVRFYDLDHDPVTLVLNARIIFSPPGGSISPQRIADPAAAAKYLINVPIMRNHSGAGVTLGFKNHFGTVEDPGNLHNFTFAKLIDYSPLVDIYKSPLIGPKTILTLGDGIFAALGQQDSAPRPWSTFGDDYPKSLFFAKDPVAIDSVMADFLDAEWGNLEGSTNYLLKAHNEGLGVFEHSSNPFADHPYTNIDYQLVDL